MTRETPLLPPYDRPPHKTIQVNRQQSLDTNPSFKTVVREAFDVKPRRVKRQCRRHMGEQVRHQLAVRRRPIPPLTALRSRSTVCDHSLTS